MNRLNRRALLGMGVAAAAGLAPLAMAGDQPKTIPAAPGQPLNITVTTAAPAPDVSLVLGSRSAKVTPCRTGCTHTGGGNIDVQQPSPDTIVVTMSGAAVAYGGPTGAASASQLFDLVQQFEVSFDKPSVKAAKLTIEGRVIGALRSHKHGCASQSASATLSGAPGAGVSLAMPSHSVCGHENVSINDKEGPLGIVVVAGKYSLCQTFRVSADMPKSIAPCKGPSAEFAPDPAIDPLWLSVKEPFHGIAKKDFGFQVTVRVVPEDLPEPGKK